MSLIELWQTSPEQLREKRVEQIIGFAGDGRLGDSNTAPAEFRAFLARIPSSILARYANECLADSFKDSGLALQDIINEIGRRLGFDVTAGRYRGAKGSIGNDGLWEAPGAKIIVEVKTTDAYRIDLDVVAAYRKKLIKEGITDEDSSSILIVVGRQDTGDLEAQIRGSKHAWDIRLISTDSLLRLVSIKEEVEDPGIEKRIRQILIPREYTRVDEIIDLVFSTTEDIRQDESLTEEHGKETNGESPSTIKDKPVAFNDACVERIRVSLGVNLVKRSRVTYQSPDAKIRLVCSVSKDYPNPRGVLGYWFAFHPHQKEFLEGAQQGYIGFGCGSASQIILIPVKEMTPLLDGMNRTERDDGRSYWHVQIHRQGNSWILQRRSGEKRVDISRYLLKQ